MKKGINPTTGVEGYLIADEIIEEQKNMKKEDYLFRLAKAILKWANVEYNKEELADFVILELMNIKEDK